MRLALAFILVAACGGPTQQQLAETPSATIKQPPANAPAASPSDKDREQMTQSFEDMETTQNAYREAGEGSGSAPPPPRQPGQPAPRKAPVEQAPK